MKRNFLLIAAFVGGFLFASCGENKDTLVKDTDAMFTQAETDLQGIDNLDDFFAFRETAKSFFAASAADSDSQQTATTCASCARSKLSNRSA